MFDIKTLDAWLATSERDIPQLRHGCEKQIVWAGAPATKTPLAVVFIHGFSASSGELRPLPDLVASDLNANLFFTRLTGHGQDGDAMGRATLAEWQRDVDEALTVARTLGDEVIVIGCSTGCTLATIALGAGAAIKGLVQISPNYGLAHKAAQILIDLPLFDKWCHLIAGATRSFPVHSDAHATYWTTTYPSKAVYPMAQAVRAAKAVNLGGILVPTFAAVNQTDQVVSASATRKVLQQWGGPVTRHPLVQTDADHAMGHIMAGDVFSPGQTAALAARITTWVRGLG